MNKLGLLITGVALVLAPIGAPAATSELSDRAQTIVDYLLDDWNTRMHSTGIALGMQNLGMEPDDELRLEVAEHFRADTGLANNLQFWGANNYVFSNEERRIVKALINAFDEDDELPTMAALVEELAITAERLRRQPEELWQSAGVLIHKFGKIGGIELARSDTDAKGVFVKVTFENATRELFVRMKDGKVRQLDYVPPPDADSD